MQKNKDKPWLIILAFIIFAIAVLGSNIYNTFEVCKDQSVYWVNGTQHTCKWFK